MSGHNVLLIEDDDAARELAQTRLSLLGYRVVACADGEEAVAACSVGDTAFDVVLLDLRLPGMTGLEVLAWLREFPATAGVPIVVVSVDPGAGIAAGADLVIAKPYHLHQLVLAIAEATARRAVAIDAH